MFKAEDIKALVATCLLRAINEEEGGLDCICRRQVKLALHRNLDVSQTGINAIFDRLVGKASQGVNLSGEVGGRQVVVVENLSGYSPVPK
jgi:hypothetical protein